MKKILIIKEACLLRDGIVGILQVKFPHFEIMARGAKDAFDMIQNKIQIDLVIIDLDTPIDFYAIINHYQNQGKKVIVWSSNIGHEDLTTLFKMKLDGYFYNGMESEELVQAIHKVFQGKCYIHPAIAEILLNDYIRIHSHESNRPIGILSQREWEVLDLMSKGFNNQQIGDALYITDKTVKNHVSAILKKLSVNDRTNAVLKAIKKRWVLV